MLLEYVYIRIHHFQRLQLLEYYDAHKY